MSSFDKSQYVHGVFSTIAPSYDLMNDLESLGLHRAWKAQLVRELSKAKPGHILDIACGTGDIALALAKANPEAEVIGLDFNEAMLKVARQRVARELPLSFVVEIGSSPEPLQEGAPSSQAVPEPEQNADAQTEAALEAPASGATAKIVSNLTLTSGNAMELPYPDESMDAVSISFGLRNMPDYATVLEEIFRVLKPEGQFYCLEASYPTNELIKPPFKLYFKHWLPVLAKLVVDSPEEYAWLNTSTEAFLSKDELVKLMVQTGFVRVNYTSFLFGAAALHRAIKQG